MSVRWTGSSQSNRKIGIENIELRGDVIRKFDGFEPSADPCGGKSAGVRIFHYSIHFKLIQLGFVIPIRPSYLRMNALNCEDMLWILLI